jgi:replicative DNA helicase
LNIENEFIAKLLVSGDFATVTDMQITGKYLNGKNRKAFQWIQKYSMKYGKTPSRLIFKKNFPNYELPKTKTVTEPMAYYCDELREKLKHNTIIDTLEDMEGFLEVFESEQAYKKVRELVDFIESEVIMSDRMEVNKDTIKRLEDYHQRAKSGGMTGIPTGIDRLDKVLKGMNKGELVTLLGYTNTGKSWLSVIIAVAMAKAGYKVLYFTTEMATRMIMRRIDAVWCMLSYTRFRDGKLHRDEFKRFKKYLEEMEGNTETNLIVEQVTSGTAQVGAKIDQHKPDMVFIDGAYLLSDEDEEDDWRGLVKIWRSLHKMCLSKNIPMFVSTQSKERVVTLQTISFAKAISNDSDVVIALEQDDQMKHDREIKLKFLKIREGSIPGAIVMNWDFDKMDYSTIYIERFDGSALDEEELEEDEEAENEEDIPVEDGKTVNKTKMKFKRNQKKGKQREKQAGVQELE